jgi:hypothetical protein
MFLKNGCNVCMIENKNPEPFERKSCTESYGDSYTNSYTAPKAVFRYAGPRPQDAGTPSLLHIFFVIIIQCNCSACNVPQDAGLHKRANFSTLILGLAGTGDRTRVTCVAGSCNNSSAIHYDFVLGS